MLGEFASYLIRSLLSEGRLVYEVVEKTPNGFRPRRIEKQGPTGLFVTTTAVRLHPENETRLLSLQVTDTPEQTRAIMRAIAESRVVAVDPGPWIALQHWLAHAEHRVVIPYASALAEQIPPVAVRLRRDFGQLLALIRAHAILHQATRERDGEGRILATLEDYAVVRTLVLDVIAEGIDATVAPIVRETVAAVQTLLADGRPRRAFARSPMRSGSTRAPPRAGSPQRSSSDICGTWRIARDDRRDSSSESRCRSPYAYLAGSEVL